MPKVARLGHVGLFVNDPEIMLEFYSRFLGMTVIDRDDRRVFLASCPDEDHHDLLLAEDRERCNEPQRLSFVLDTLSDLREFYAQILERGYQIDRVSNHGNAIGCYFRDPEFNRVEVYWHTDIDCPQPCNDTIDLTMSEDRILDVLDEMEASAGLLLPRTMASC